METKIHQATERHKKGYNCAQAVACTYSDRFGMSEVPMFRMIEGFGAGMGNMKGVCGAVSGAIALAGLKQSCGDLENPNTKAVTYKLSKQIMEKFEERCGSVICETLKGVRTGKPLCSCPDCILEGARLVEEVLLEEK